MDMAVVMLSSFATKHSERSELMLSGTYVARASSLSHAVDVHCVSQIKDLGANGSSAKSLDEFAIQTIAIIVERHNEA